MLPMGAAVASLWPGYRGTPPVSTTGGAASWGEAVLWLHCNARASLSYPDTSKYGAMLRPDGCMLAVGAPEAFDGRGAIQILELDATNHNPQEIHVRAWQRLDLATMPLMFTVPGSRVGSSMTISHALHDVQGQNDVDIIVHSLQGAGSSTQSTTTQISSSALVLRVRLGTRTRRGDATASGLNSSALVDTAGWNTRTAASVRSSVLLSGAGTGVAQTGAWHVVAADPLPGVGISAAAMMDRGSQGMHCSPGNTGNTCYLARSEAASFAFVSSDSEHVHHMALRGDPSSVS